MSVVKKFNGLNGSQITRKATVILLEQSHREEQSELAKRLAAVLANNPKEKTFIFKIQDPAIEQVPESLLPGFQEDELNEESGLSGVSQSDIYDMVTDMIINTIKKVGHLPWQKEWTGSGGGDSAMNYVTGKAYNGINWLMLNFDCLYDEHGEPYLVKTDLKQPYYLTFKQIEKAGAKLTKGSKARNVFYYSPIFTYKAGEHNFKSSDKGKFNAFIKENGISADDVKRNAAHIPIIKYYNVYKADDCTGLKFPERPIRNAGEPIEIAQSIIDHYPNPPKFTFGGDGAAFYPKADIVNMPILSDFSSPAYYYATYFHEIVHSTGHSKRLNRGNDTKKRDGSSEDKKAYAFEELVAELGAVYLSGEAGILFHTKDNNAKYLKYWTTQLSKYLKEDNKFFFKAAAAAQKGANHILDLNADGVPAYLLKAIKNVPAVIKEKKSKAVAKKVATKPVTKVSDIIGYAIVDNISGSIVASKPRLTDLETVFHTLELYKDFKDMPVLVYEIIKAGKKNKLGKAVNVDWKQKPAVKPASQVPAAKRKRKKQDSQQLTLGLNGKKKAGSKQGLNAIFTEQQFSDTVEEMQNNPIPVLACPVTETLNSRSGSRAERRAQRQNETREYYKIANEEIGCFLGNVEIKKKESVAITLAGGQGSMKTRMLFQAINAFGQNYKIGHISIEEHPDSQVYADKEDQYLNQTALNNLTAPENVDREVLHKLIVENDIIFIDSFQKMQELIPRFELDKDLRKAYDGKLFFIIFQQTSDGQMRGGTKSQFDADIVLFTEKCPDYRDNYVYPDKNRYNSLPADQLKFNIFSGKMLKPAVDPVPAPVSSPTPVPALGNSAPIPALMFQEIT